MSALIRRTLMAAAKRRASTPPLLAAHAAYLDAAYGQRRLFSGNAVAAMRVRRASDNAEQDIGWVGNALDASALTAFCAGTQGFVTTLYDQGPNGYHMRQSNPARQPIVVSGGVWLGSIQFDGIDDYLVTAQLSTNNAKQVATFNGKLYDHVRRWPDNNAMPFFYGTSYTLAANGGVVHNAHPVGWEQYQDYGNAFAVYSVVYDGAFADPPSGLALIKNGVSVPPSATIGSNPANLPGLYQMAIAAHFDGTLCAPSTLAELVVHRARTSEVQVPDIHALLGQP